jgi:hypothetical protein
MVNQRETRLCLRMCAYTCIYIFEKKRIQRDVTSFYYLYLCVCVVRNKQHMYPFFFFFRTFTFFSLHLKIYIIIDIYTFKSFQDRILISVFFLGKVFVEVFKRNRKMCFLFFEWILSFWNCLRAFMCHRIV